MEVKIFLSSFDLDVLLEYRTLKPNAEINVLLSYGTVNGDYYDMIVTHRDKINCLILDSGAFTYNCAGEAARQKINLDGFKSYCKVFNDKFNFKFNFDINFTDHGYDENCRNQDAIENAGVENVVPVVHDYLGKNTDEVGEFIKRYPLISLGSSKYRTDKKVVAKIVKRIKDAGKKVHLLGVSAYNSIKDIPIDYSDSSNWAQAQKFGYIYFWNQPYDANNPDIMLRFRDKEIDNPNNTLTYFEKYPHRSDVEKYIKDELGITYRDLYGHNATFCRQLVNTHYFVKLQDHVREAHIENGFDKLYP